MQQHDDPTTTISPAIVKYLQEAAVTTDSSTIRAAAILASTPPPPRIRAIARKDADGNPVFWGVLDEVNPGDMLILTDGSRDWPARVTTATDTLIIAQDAHGQWLFSRRGPRAGQIVGH